MAWRPLFHVQEVRPDAAFLAPSSLNQAASYMPQIPEICRLFTSPRSEDEFFNTDKRVFGDCLSGKLLKGEAATLPSPVAMHGASFDPFAFY